LGVHDSSDGAFLTRASAVGPASQPQTLLVHLPEIGDAGNVIVSNITEGNRPARFRLRALELLQEDAAAAAAEEPPDPNQLAARSEPRCSTTGRLTLAGGEAGAAGDDRARAAGRQRKRR